MKEQIDIDSVFKSLDSFEDQTFANAEVSEPLWSAISEQTNSFAPAKKKKPAPIKLIIYVATLVVSCAVAFFAWLLFDKNEEQLPSTQRQIDAPVHQTAPLLPNANPDNQTPQSTAKQDDQSNENKAKLRNEILSPKPADASFRFTPNSTKKPIDTQAEKAEYKKFEEEQITNNE